MHIFQLLCMRVKVGLRGSFPRGKAAGAWSWPLTCV